MLDPRGVRAALGRQDCVVDIGAGDSFAEIYGLKRFLFLWLTKVYALMQGRPLLLAPQTIGPFTKPLYKALAKGVKKKGDAWIVIGRAEFGLGNKAGVLAAYREAAKYPETKKSAEQALRQAGAK